jgi:nicotinamidase/pyrazinamidase
VIVDKAQDRYTQGYSSFHGGRLADVLRERGVDHVYVAGLATDYCVKNTALDAVREGFGVTVVEDAIHGIDLKPGDSERAIEEMKGAGAGLVSSKELLAERAASKARS